MKTTGYILTLEVITKFVWFNDVIDLRHNGFLTSASSNKTGFDFYLFVDALYGLKSDDDA